MRTHTELGCRKEYPITNRNKEIIGYVVLRSETADTLEKICQVILTECAETLEEKLPIIGPKVFKDKKPLEFGIQFLPMIKESTK